MFARLSPVMGGLGYTMVALTFFFAIYYNVIIAYAIHYLLAGMTPKAELPWAVGPRALKAGDANPHPKWSTLGNSSVRATCCYEQVLDAYNKSGLPQVPKSSRCTCPKGIIAKISYPTFIRTCLSISGCLACLLERSRFS